VLHLGGVGEYMSQIQDGLSIQGIWGSTSYVIHMFLTRRLKITFTSNLKLIISFLVFHIVLLSLFKSLILVASSRHTALNLACLLEVGRQAYYRLRYGGFGSIVE
jgi:hypothetical protein